MPKFLVTGVAHVEFGVVVEAASQRDVWRLVSEHLAVSVHLGDIPKEQYAVQDEGIEELEVQTADEVKG